METVIASSPIYIAFIAIVFGMLVGYHIGESAGKKSSKKD